MNKRLDSFTARNRRAWLVPGSLLLAAIFLTLTLAGLATAARPADPAAQLHDAWKQAQQAGSYAFTSDIEQTLIPQPTIYNVGRGDEHVALRAEGQVRLPDYSYLRLLPVLAPPGAELTPIEVERIGAETWVTMDGERQRMDNPAGIAAPTGDYLAYLEAARDVQELSPVTAGGVRYQRLAFAVDGPAFTENVRQRLEEQVAADLPQGARLQPPRSLETLSGQGELWVGPDGLPRRQILELTLPDASDDYAAEARIVTDFSDFGLREAAISVGQGPHLPISSSPYLPTIVKGLIPLTVLTGLVLLLAYRQRPRVYASVTMLVIAAMLIQPFVPGWKLARFKARYGPSIAEAAPPAEEPSPAEPSPQEQSSLRELLKGLDMAATPGAAPPGSPEAERLDAQATAWRDQLGITAYYEELALKYDNQDYDGDGLSDAYEMVLGTFTDTVDSDFDLITDTLEVEGFDYNGEHWSTSPLDPDTNRDTLKDNLEWAYPIGQAGGPNPYTRPPEQRFDTDLDGVPDLWDDDNDGDGVPDAVDISPFRSLSGAKTSLPLTVNPGNHEGPIYVDLELRPTDADHLRYTLKTLDWPDDDRGQMRDLDQSTDDLTLIPMLRVESNVAPMQATQYGISVQHDPDTGKYILYVPLTLVDAGGYPAAFHSRAVFSGADVPAGRAIQWQVELVWVIQAKVDSQVCEEDDETNCHIAIADTPVHLYTDQFTVTGAHVSKEAGMETAVFATPDRDNEGDLAALLFGLEKSFLETPPWREESEPQVPDRLDQIVERFRNPASYPITQTFFITTPVVSVYDTFDHADEAVATLTMTMTKGLLDTHFPEAETAFLLHATEHQGGDLGLAEFGQQDGSLIVNLGDAPIMVVRALQLSQYQYDASGWKVMNVKEVLQSVEQRFGPLVANGSITENELRATKLFWLVASQGIQAVVKLDSRDFEYPKDLTGTVFKILRAAGSAAGDKLPLMAGKLLTDPTRVGWGWWDTLKWARDHMRVTQMVLMAAILILAVLIATKAISDEITFLVQVALAANMAKETVSVYRAIKWAHGAEGSWTRMEWGLRNARMWAGIVVLVIQIALIWYMFYETVNQPGVTEMQWWLALQVAIGMTILAIIFFVLGLTVVGLIIVFIIQLIFWIASWFGYDVESKIAQAIGELFLDVDLLATMPEKDGAFFDDPSAGLADAQAGFTKGNQFILAGTFRGYVVATEDGSADDVARSKVWADAHVTAPVTVTVGHSRGDETCQATDDSEKRVCTNSLEGRYILPDPAINLPLKFGLDVGYSFAFRHCWRAPVTYPPITLYCETEQTEGTAESKEEDLSDLYVDVFPSSLDDLWSWNSLVNTDRDADGVSDAQELDVSCDPPYQHSKTSLQCADSDGDGLLDGYEIQQRDKLSVDPVRADADEDGLTDAEELKWNTRPDWADTDADGLTDEKDLVHAVRPDGNTPELQGGWDMDFGGIFPAAQAFPLPNNADPDSDGLTDNREWELRTNPRAFVPGLTVIVSPQPTPDTVLTAGSAMSVTVSALNFSPKTIAPDVIICMGNLVTIDYLDLVQHLTSAHDVHYRIYERNPQCPDGSLGRRLTIYSGVDTGEWATFIVAANVISPVATSVLTTTGIVEYTWEGQARTVADRFVYKVDGDAPQSTILYPTEGAFLTGGYVVVGGEARDPTSQVGKVELDVSHDQQWRLATGQESWAYTWELPPDGDYTLRVQATDVFPDIDGHREQPGPEVHVTVDQTPPQSTIQSPADGGQTSVPIGADSYRTLTITGQAQDNLSGVTQVRVSPVRPRRDATLDNPGGDTTTWQTTLQLPTGRPNGRFDLTSTARDGAGNVETDQTPVQVTVDNTPPQVTLTEAPAAPVTGTNPVALRLQTDELAPFGPVPQPKALQGTLDATDDATVRLEPAPGDGSLTLNTWGDFNGDDLDDLAVADVWAGTVHVLFGQPGGWPPELNLAAAAVTAGPFAGAITSLSAGDLNGDGYDELVIASGDGVRVFLGHDRGWPGQLDRDAAEAVLFADRTSRTAVAGDVNGDGMDDLLAAAGEVVYLALGDAGLSLQPAALSLPSQTIPPKWEGLSNVPANMGYGGRITAWDGRIWAMIGDSSKSFFVYDPQSNTWTPKADLPESVRLGGALAASGDGYLYAVVGSTGFYRYDPGANNWTSRQSVPVFPGDGVALAADGAGYLYLIVGNERTAFYRYDIAANTWTQRADVPQAVEWGGALAWASGALYAFPGKDSNAFYRYDPAEDAWTRLANAPGNIGSGGSLAWNRSQYIYALRGQARSHFYRYDLQTNTWEVLPSVPANVHEGGALVWLHDYLYATRGDHKSDFWRIYASDIPYVRLAGLGDINGDSLDDFAVSDLAAGTVYLFYGREGRAPVASSRPNELIAQRAWQRYTTDDGLGSHQVRDVLREPDGTVWVATANGVSRLRPGGTRWTNFTSGTNGPADSAVNCLARDPAGNLWVGTENGLSRRAPDGTWTHFRTDQGAPTNWVETLAAGPDGSIWIGAFFDGVGLGRRLPDGTWVQYTTQSGLAGMGILALAITADGSVWVGSYDVESGSVALQHLDDNGTPLDVYDDRWTTYRTINGRPLDDVSDIAFDAAGGVWVAGYRLAYLAPGAAQWRLFTTADGLVSNHIKRIAIDNDLGTIWLLHSYLGGDDPTGRQLSLRGPDGRWQRVSSAPASFLEFTSLAIEPGFGLWVGFYGDGVGHLTADPNLRTGAAIAGVGDVDGDGLDDLLVGEPGYDSDAGRALLFKGQQSWPSILFTSDADAALAGESNDQAGAAVGPAGDVNSDGLDDLLVAGEGGKAWLLHGRTGNWPSLSGADATWTNASPALSAQPGDANCDASPDLLIPAEDNRAGLFFGPVGNSCAVADTGVSTVEVGLGQVDDPAQPAAATLPATWQQATPSGGMWQADVAEPADGLLRLYARGTDSVGNVASDPAAWAAGRWRDLPDVPQAVGNGGRMVVVGDRVYVAPGGGSRRFYSFPVAAALGDPTAGTWQRLAYVPANVAEGSGVASAGDGGIYLLAGPLASDNFWHYDIATNAWSPLSDYPKTPGFTTAIAGDGLGTAYVLQAAGSRAFYRYTPAAGWEQLADAPASGNWGHALTVVRRPGGGTYVYALRGRQDVSDFWRYDPTQDLWEVLPNVPGHPGGGGSLAWACAEPDECDGGDPSTSSGQGYIYALRGWGSPDFYRYHIPTSRWEVLPDAPATVHEGGSLAWAAGGLFALRGGSHTDFWRWDDLLLVDRTPPEITWEPAGGTITTPSLMLTARVTDTLVGMDNVVFEATEGTLPATYNPGSGLWRMIALPSWQELAPVPRRMNWGARIAAWDGRIWAATSGRYGEDFYAYDPSTGRWTKKAGGPTNLAGKGGALTAGGDGYLYAAAGQVSFYRYDIVHDRWTSRHRLPYGGQKPAGEGAALTADGAGHLYYFYGSGENLFYRYDIDTDRWTRLADVPQAVSWGGALAWAVDAVYAFPANGSAAFYRYDPATNTWRRLVDAPASIGPGGSLAWAGDQYIYALRGQRKTDFYRYNLNTGAWASLTLAPGNVQEGGALAWLDGRLYATRGDGYTHFWWYDSGEAGITIRPKAVDRLGNVGYGDERTFLLDPPDLSNVVENYVDGDIVTTGSPAPDGTAVASQGINEITFTRTRLEDGSTITDRAVVTGTRYHWTYDQDFGSDFPWGNGTYSVTVGVKDIIDAEVLSDPLRLIVDTQSPAVAFTNLADASVLTATGRITVTGTATDATSGVTAVRFSPDNTASWREAFLDSGTWSATWDVPTLDGQPWHLAVQATDRGGLTTQQRIALTVDNVLPGGLTPVTFNLDEGTHTGVGASLQVNWSAATDGSGIAGTFVALDQITNTVPTAPAAGTSFSGSFDAAGDWYFHLRAADNANNWLIRHYGPWHVSDAGLGLSGGTIIVVVDGVLDIAHGEWLPEFHLLDEDVRTAGQAAQLYANWDADDFFLGWQGGIWSLDGEAWFLFDTGPGGAIEVAGHALPFGADYAFTVDHFDIASFLVWDGGQWVPVAGAGVQFAHSNLASTEVRIPLAALGSPTSLNLVAFAQPDQAEASAWAVFPATNPLAGPWNDAYAWPELGPNVMPSADQPVADHTRLVVSSVQPPAVHLGMGSVITYEIRLENAGLQAAENARLTLEASPGLAYFSAEGDGTCESCDPGSTTWTWQFGDLPSGEWRSLTVGAQVVDANAAGGAVTTTTTLHTTRPDATPADNVVTVSHVVDAVGLQVVLTDPSGEDAVRPGQVTVLGTVPPGQGASAARVEVAVTVGEDPAAADWQLASGTHFWTGEVEVPEGVEAVWVWARAWDILGNVGPVVGIQVPVDSVAPQATIDQPATSPALAGGQALEVTGHADDEFPANGRLDEVEIQLDGGPWGAVNRLLRQEDGAYAWSWRWLLPEDEEGVTHNLRVRAVDAAGNVSEPSPPMEVIVDTIAPITEIAYPADGDWLEPGTTQVLVWGWSEDGVGVDRVEVSLDAGLTWAQAVVADEAQAMLTDQPETRNPKLETGNPKPETAMLWAFAGTLPEDQTEYFIRARSVDTAGNVELTEPTVVVYMVVSRFWLPLVLKS